MEDTTDFVREVMKRGYGTIDFTTPHSAPKKQRALPGIEVPEVIRAEIVRNGVAMKMTTCSYCRVPITVAPDSDNIVCTDCR